MFSQASPGCVLQCLPLFTCFRAISSAYMFSRVCHTVRVFPPLPPFTCFRALSSPYIFSRAYHCSRVFARFPLVLFSRACHRLRVFQRFYWVHVSHQLLTSFANFSFPPWSLFCVSVSCLLSFGLYFRNSSPVAPSLLQKEPFNSLWRTSASTAHGLHVNRIGSARGYRIKDTRCT